MDEYEKLYNEALERARKQRNDYQKELDKTDKSSQLAGLLRAGISAIELVYPELRESEDERIMQEIIDFIQWAEDRGMTRHDYHQAKRPVVWIAYLEKQKVTAAIPDELVECYKNLCERGNRGVASLINAINGVNDQKEQKPADRFEEAREKYQVEWSDKDKMNLNGCICSLHQYGYMAYADFLKHLPERFNLQPKQEWSEEDREMIERLIRHTQKEFDELCNDRYGHQEIISDLKESCRERMNWLEKLLKSLRPVSKESLQSHWKPSEEQIHAIVEALKYLPNNKDEWRILNTLVDVFKKLM